MAMAMIKLRPGVNVELTASLNEAGYSISSLIRYRNGLAEKLGGWQKYVQFAVGGVPKVMHAWLDFNETEYLTVGTTTILANIPDGGAIADLTPQLFTSDFTPDFDTTNLSTTVTINDPNIANVTDLDAIEFKTPISVGGIILSGAHQIGTVTGATTYTITAATAATATVNSGGAVPVFTTDADSTEVSVLFEDHGLQEGDTINFPIPTAISVSGNNSFMKSLVHFNGADAATTALDVAAGATATHTWTAAGNAQIDTASFALGGASTLLDGTGDYWTTPDHADFTLGSGVWAFGLRFRVNVAGGSVERLFGQCDGTATDASTSIRGYRTAGNVIEVVACVGGTAFTVTGTTQFTNAVNTGWHSLVFRRNASNQLQLFLDDVQEGGNIAIAGTVNDSAEVWAIGTTGAVTTDPWTGWADEAYLYVGDSSGDPFSGTAPDAEWGEGDIDILGTYTAISITDADNFTIAIAQVPDSTGVFAMNMGLAELVYYIALGPTTSGTGYGTGTYSSGPYSIGVGVTSVQTGTPIAADDWTLDNWGDTLLACPEGGGIYSWRPNTGFETAQLIAEGPLFNSGMFISQQTQMVIAYGSTALQDIGLDQDPLLVKWCDNGDFTSWAVGVASQAGSRRLSTGSKIVGGLSVAQQELIWTDLGLWAMTYLGSLEAGVWGFNQIGLSCGLIGKHAHARLGAYVYWMSAANFFRLGQAPEVIPCTVWDVVFQDLNTEHQHKSWAWANTPFNEVFFFFPRASTGATDPDYYVKLNTLDPTAPWDHGPLPRTCGIDQSLLGKPISATPAGIIYQHETSPNADGAALTASFTTGFFQISDGQDNMFVDWFLPDFKWNEYPATTGASIQITLYSQYYPGSTPQTHGPFTVTAATPYFNPRLRGRLVSMKVESSDLDSFWRLGGCRARIAPDGRVP